MTLYVFSEGMLRATYTEQELEELAFKKTSLLTHPGDWAYWTKVHRWFSGSKDGNGFNFIDENLSVPKEYQALLLLLPQ